MIDYPFTQADRTPEQDALANEYGAASAELQALLVRAARLRVKVAWAKNVMDEEIRRAKAGETYRTSMDLLAAFITERDQAEEAAKAAALVVYKLYPAGGKKRDGWGISTKHKPFIHYEPTAAREWAFKNVPGLLDLNTAKFEAYATAMATLNPVPGVEMGEELSDVAQLAADLSKFLPDGPSIEFAIPADTETAGPAPF